MKCCEKYVQINTSEEQSMLNTSAICYIYCYTKDLLVSNFGKRTVTSLDITLQNYHEKTTLISTIT